ncbi:MAG: porin [Gammaproteobacteria bacterium]|nr:porin [Gammaproteobacteria bacterium]
MRKTTRSALAACVALVLVAPRTHAVNWLALQGTEPAGSTTRVRLWGFVQPEFQSSDGTPLTAGAFAGQPASFNQVAPGLDEHAEFLIRRARLGLRGHVLPQDGMLDYFLLLEAGDNGITRYTGGRIKFTDASVTLNHLPGARIRLGQFKYPGAEEGLMAIQSYDYINFSNATNFLLQERFFDSDGSINSLDEDAPNGAVGAFRDIGVQLFDAFMAGAWEHSYAAMLGNGNGLLRGDDNSSKDVYLYWASERVFAGKGPRRQGWKLFAWHQQGERTLATAAIQTVSDFDRTRWGLGTTLRKDRYRAAAEYIRADGMIFNGTDGGAVPGTLNNAGTAVASWNVLPDDEADGWYIDAGYMVLPKLELDLRYDTLNRATRTAAEERSFTTWTLGAQYAFTENMRVMVNYEFRAAEAPQLADGDIPNQILEGMDDLMSVQLQASF